MSRLLMVTFDFPPSKRVAVQRSLAFSYHLKARGWDLDVLTVKERCYDGFVDEKLFYPQELRSSVRRVSAINATKIGIKGKYIDIFAIPDEWVSWLFFGLPAGMKIIRDNGPELIWSTCPPFTPHLLAGILSKRSGIPWVADFRDPVIDGPYDVYGKRWAVNAVDKFTIKNADRIVFATEESLDIYRKKYPALIKDKGVVIENGFYDLPDIERTNITLPNNDGVYKVLYSGSIYGGRDPSAFFEAIRQLWKEGAITVGSFQLIFQGVGHDDYLVNLIDEYQLNDLVVLMPSVGFEASLQAMVSADALLLIQGESFNPQIPAKVYEYIAAKRPIIGFCHPAGATKKLLDSVSNACCGNNTGELKSIVNNLILSRDEEVYGDINQYSRYAKTMQLVELLEQLLPHNR